MMNGLHHRMNEFKFGFGRVEVRFSWLYDDRWCMTICVCMTEYDGFGEPHGAFIFPEHKFFDAAELDGYIERVFEVFDSKEEER